MTMDDDAERKLRERAEARVQAREAFTIHLVVYLAVNALLWVIWAYNGANLSAPWPIFVTLGWGIGLVAHGWTVYAQSEDRHAAAVEAEMRKLRERDR
ncbi:MAG TPA: 2TM domain-containing protein [Patescibacteria group bacterium]|nr:2TM domain-containing protein [Patescibacteria group bacterium]